MICLSNYLKNISSIAIGGHVRPDGDCVGSTMGMYKYLTSNYPELTVDLYLEDIPFALTYISGTDCIKHEIADKDYDLFIALDAADVDRLGFSRPLFDKADMTICIDHHISNKGYAKVNYIVPDASSASELVYNVLEEEKITLPVAEALYMGIVHDTGVFQYSCCQPKTMITAAKLLSLGVDAPNLISETFYEKTYEQNKVLGHALVKCVLSENGRYISCYITKKEMEDLHVTPKDFDGIVSQMRVTKGVEVSIFLYEQEANVYKVSMRSKDRMDVSKVASMFGGGGHIKAAGATMSGEPEEIIETLIGQLKLQE